MSSNEAPPTKRRRSSSSVTLVLVGASALSACGPGSDSTDMMQRDLYASKADCVQDWGADPGKCEPAPASSTTRPGSSHYWGPAYSRGAYNSSNTRASGTTSQARSGSRAIGSSSVSRGGFGSRASSHSSSGSRASSSS